MGATFLLMFKVYLINGFFSLLTTSQLSVLFPRPAPELGYLLLSPHLSNLETVQLMLTTRASPSGWSHVMGSGLLISLQAAEISGRLCASATSPLQVCWRVDQEATPGGSVQAALASG